MACCTAATAPGSPSIPLPPLPRVAQPPPAPHLAALLVDAGRGGSARALTAAGLAGRRRVSRRGLHVVWVPAPVLSGPHRVIGKRRRCRHGGASAGVECCLLPLRTLCCAISDAGRARGLQQWGGASERARSPASQRRTHTAAKYVALQIGLDSRPGRWGALAKPPGPGPPQDVSLRLICGDKGPPPAHVGSSAAAPGCEAPAAPQTEPQGALSQPHLRSGLWRLSVLLLYA